MTTYRMLNMNSSQLSALLMAFTAIALSVRPATAILPVANTQSFNCTFDQNLCGWTQSESDDFDWERRNKDEDNSTDTGPAHDHTGDGYYMFTNSKDYTTYQTAVLVSPYVNATNQPKCFQFYYLMHGAQIGSLNIYLSTDGSMNNALWSRIHTQGIFYLLGQVTLVNSGWVLIEGTGSSGNDGDIAIDDVGLIDGPCAPPTTHNSYESLSCDFELDMCGYMNAPSTVSGWHRSAGESLMMEDTFDHTTRSATGFFITINDSDNVDKKVPLLSGNITSQGSFCVSFFYREQGVNAGLLSVSVLDYRTNIWTQSWQDMGTSVSSQWNKAQFSLNITSVVQLSFDAAIQVGDGDLSIDDISVLPGSCETPPACNFDKYNLCSWVNDFVHDYFYWEIATSGGDAKTLAPWRDADDNETGGFILLDMGSNPGMSEAYLVSEALRVNGSQCFNFYFYPMIRSSEFGETPMVLNIYVSTGNDFPGTLYWSYSMTEQATAFIHGQVPFETNVNHRIVIGGLVSLGQGLSLDKFSLDMADCPYLPAEARPSTTTIVSTTTATTTRQPLPSTSMRPHSLWDCDFEAALCHWMSNQTGNSTWTRRQPGYYLNGPHFDHTTGPGGHGYFLTLDKVSGKLQTDTPLKASTNYCLIFWIYLYGSADFEFTVQTMNTSSTMLMYKQDSMGTAWHQMTLDLPVSSVPLNVEFSYGQKSSGDRNQLALDDIQVLEGRCSLEVGPNCTFDRGSCSWENSKDNDFNFTMSTASGQASGEIQSDHTTETDLGSFIKTTTNGHSEGQKAHFQSPKLTFSNSVCMRFYYYVTSSCDSDLSIETLGLQDRHSVPLLDLQDILYEEWQLGEVTIYDPQGTQVIFTFTAGQNKSCQVGFDDVEFGDGECLYRGTSDFENGFDVFHNVYSSDFNWVIASPSDGIFTWLPPNDFSTNSPTGHFAVAAYPGSSPTGKKTELWGQLSPPMDHYCTSFYLYIHGSDPGVLNVTLVDYLDDTRVVVWSYTPTFANRDARIYAQFPHVYDRQFYVVFTVVLGSEGGWAIDSIDTYASATCKVMPIQAAASTVAPPTIPPPPTTAASSHVTYGECDFEIDMCNWYVPDYSQPNWTRTSGDSDLPFSPQQGRPGGKKFFLTVPSAPPGDLSAVLQSPTFNNDSSGNTTRRKFDFRLWLNMDGELVGMFRVSLTIPTISETVYFQSTATNSWEQIEFSVNANGPFSLTIEGQRNSKSQDSISIDDIEVSDTPVLDDDNVYKCTFESPDMCGFTQDTSDNMDWVWFGEQPDVLMQDHTYLTSLGHVVLVNHTQGNPGDIARLISQTVPPMSGCLTFWLMMISDGEALRVYLASGQEEELISQKRNTQGYVWTKSETPVSSNVPFHITLEAEVLGERSSDLIIDDFELSSSACASPGACTFERDMCTWENSLFSGFDFDWIRGTGSTVGVAGPAVDSTTGSASGYFMYIDSSGPYKYHDKAWLDSEIFPKGEQCLHFYYFMSGVSVGTLSVYTVILDSVNDVMVWSLTGDQGDGWSSAMVTVGTYLVNYNVRIEGALGFSVTNNIAIDDITFLPGACDILPSDAKSFSEVSTTPAPVTKHSTQIILERCDFSDDFPCGFKNGTSDNFWVRSGLNMSISDTLKPFSGHSTNKTDSFIYAQVGNDLKENSTARLISPVYAALNGEAKCLQFYYHMNGDQVGQLSVYIAPDGQDGSLTTEMRLWSQNFDAGPGWKKGLVPILQASSYHVVFEAVRSKVDYYYGIDDLTIFDNECGAPESCDFEVDSCLWSNEGGETDSNIPWKRYRGDERSALFAPTVDHTTQTVDGYYMFVESSLAAAGDVARLYSQVFAGSSSPYCLHFWYYMFGSKLGQLKVFVRNTISSSSYFSDADLWQLNDPTGNSWFLAQVNISQAYTRKPFMVIIEAAVGSTLLGAFGIDDTQFEVAECGTQPSAAVVTANAQMDPDCDFEYGDTCDWTVVPFAGYTFTVVDAGGDIAFDHSGGTGKFLLADSNKVPERTSVFIQSPLLPPTFGTNCLTLWYNMQDSGLADLQLSLVNGGDDLILWEVYSEETNGWNSIQINIQNNFDYKLKLTATVGTKDAGSVAIDDITLTHGACPRSELITFEEGLSDFSPTASSNIHWVIKLASDSFMYSDHTYDTSAGHVLQVDLGNATTVVKTAEIQSPLYPSVGDECMEFYYSKKGETGGWFNIRVSESGQGAAAGDSDTVWHTTADTKGVWKRVLLDISSESPYWIIFQAGANNSQVTDSIIIDDLSFRPEVCPSAVNCDFDLGTCDYTNSPNAMFSWNTVKGAYSDSLMPFDQTIQSDQGGYMEVDFPSSIDTYTADLISPVEMQTTSKCLLFWYYGDGEGTLQVFTQTGPNQRQSLATRTISADETEQRQFRGWKDAQVDVNSTAPYSIVFEAVTKKPDTSFAIDTIKLMNGTCASLADTSDTDPSVGPPLDPKNALLGCDFERSDFCNFTSGDSRSFSWQLFSFNSSHSPETGVDFDHTKDNNYGHHAYMDAAGHKFNTTAQLVSPSFVNDKFVCLSFYYAMYGRDVNTLNVYVAQGQRNTLFWTRSDNQGEEWRHQVVEIGEAPQATKVVFEGVVGRSDQSDIDLDDIWIFDGRCPPPEFCDFEDSEICQMDQDNLNDMDWAIQDAALATGSEPSTDHTYGTEQGSYLLLDMTKTTSSQEARIFTRQYNADSARCLAFWFHFTNPVNGSHTLAVSLQDERGIQTTLITLRGVFTEEWTQAIFPLQPTENFQIVFDGQSGGSSGNIALDDVGVSADECKSYIDCDFESHDMCGWQPVPEHSNPSWEVIPPNHYMLLNFTEVRNNDVQFSQVQSQIIPPGMQQQFCFTFNYMMYGTNVGFLNISVEVKRYEVGYVKPLLTLYFEKVEYPEPQSILIFSVYGDQGRDTWRYAYGDNPQVYLGISRFVITGSTTSAATNTTQTSAILVTDIVVALESCTDWVTEKEAFFPCSADFQVPVSSVCDFIDDCVGSLDELSCGACDFEKDYCKWEDDSTGAQKFTAISAPPNVVFTDPHPGIFLALQRADGILGGSSDLVLDQELGPSPYNCTMVFSYYMSVESHAVYGNLYVSIEENNEETVVWESSQGNNSNWQTASVDVGNIIARFKIHFASKYLPFDNAMGIDDIRFQGCSFAEVITGPCKTNFTCTSNGACIDSSTKLCDFTDECKDASDENPAICSDYLMDNFEDSFGDWSQDDHDDFDWSRHSGRWISSSSGPRRDHTLGTHFGHYLLCESGAHSNGNVARLISPEFLPTTNNNCKIRFYYHMHGSDQGQLTLYILSRTSNRTQQLVQYFTKPNDNWLFGSSDLNSVDNFQVMFEGKVVGKHSTDIGLDDVTFTPQCQLKYPSSNRPGFKTSVTTARLSDFTSTLATTVPPRGQPSTEGTSAVTSSGPNSPGATATTKSSGFTTRQSASTTKTTVQTGSATNFTVPTGSTPSFTVPTGSTPSFTVPTGSATNFTVPTGSATTIKPATEGISAGSDADSWKVPVGVVLGLVGLVVVLAGAILYLRHKRTFNWMTFPLLRRSIKTHSGESNPAFEYDTTGSTAISMTERKPISRSPDEVFGQSTEKSIMSETYAGLSNPMYSES